MYAPYSSLDPDLDISPDEIEHYRRGGASPQRQFPLNSPYGTVFFTTAKHDFLHAAARLAWTILGTEWSRRLLNLSLQQVHNDGSSTTTTTTDQSPLSTDTIQPDERLAARIKSWLDASDTTICIARTPSSWGYVRPQAYKEIILSSRVLQYLVPVNDPAYPRAVFFVAMILAHECCQSMRMCLASQSDAPTVSYSASRHIKAVIAKKAYPQRYESQDAREPGAGEGDGEGDCGEWWEEQMLGGCIGIDVHEKKIRRIAHVTFRKGQKEWAWLSDAQIQDIVEGPWPLIIPETDRIPGEPPEGIQWSAPHTYGPPHPTMPVQPLPDSIIPLSGHCGVRKRDDGGGGDEGD